MSSKPETAEEEREAMKSYLRYRKRRTKSGDRRAFIEVLLEVIDLEKHHNEAYQR